MKTNPSVLALGVLVAAIAVIALSLIADASEWITIPVLLVGIAVAAGALGALVTTLRTKS